MILLLKEEPKQETAGPGIASSQKLTLGQYGVFAQAATGENDFITLENNKVELKISRKGGKVYSARTEGLQNL